MSSTAQEKSSIRQQVSDQEWQARVDLAAAYRLGQGAALTWPGLLRKLDRIDPSFRE